MTVLQNNRLPMVNSYLQKTFKRVTKIKDSVVSCLHYYSFENEWIPLIVTIDVNDSRLVGWLLCQRRLGENWECRQKPRHKLLFWTRKGVNVYLIKLIRVSTHFRCDQRRMDTIRLIISKVKTLQRPSCNIDSRNFTLSTVGGPYINPFEVSVVG